MFQATYNLVLILRDRPVASKTTEAYFYVEKIPDSTEKEGKTIELHQKKATMALSAIELLH